MDPAPGGHPEPAWPPAQEEPGFVHQGRGARPQGSCCAEMLLARRRETTRRSRLRAQLYWDFQLLDGDGDGRLPACDAELLLREVPGVGARGQAWCDFLRAHGHGLAWPDLEAWLSAAPQPCPEPARAPGWARRAELGIGCPGGTAAGTGDTGLLCPRSQSRHWQLLDRVRDLEPVEVVSWREALAGPRLAAGRRAEPGQASGAEALLRGAEQAFLDGLLSPQGRGRARCAREEVPAVGGPLGEAAVLPAGGFGDLPAAPRESCSRSCGPAHQQLKATAQDLQRSPEAGLGDAGRGLAATSTQMGPEPAGARPSSRGAEGPSQKGLRWQSEGAEAQGGAGAGCWQGRPGSAAGGQREMQAPDARQREPGALQPQEKGELCAQDKPQAQEQLRGPPPTARGGLRREPGALPPRETPPGLSEALARRREQDVDVGVLPAQAPHRPPDLSTAREPTGLEMPDLPRGTCQAPGGLQRELGVTERPRDPQPQEVLLRDPPGLRAPQARQLQGASQTERAALGPPGCPQGEQGPLQIQGPPPRDPEALEPPEWREPPALRPRISQQGQAEALGPLEPREALASELQKLAQRESEARQPQEPPPSEPLEPGGAQGSLRGGLEPPEPSAAQQPLGAPVQPGEPHGQGELPAYELQPGETALRELAAEGVREPGTPQLRDAPARAPAAPPPCGVLPREPGAGEMKEPDEAAEPREPPVEEVKALEAQGPAPMALEPCREPHGQGELLACGLQPGETLALRELEEGGVPEPPSPGDPQIPQLKEWRGPGARPPKGELLREALAPQGFEGRQVLLPQAQRGPEAAQPQLRRELGALEPKEPRELVAEWVREPRMPQLRDAPPRAPAAPPPCRVLPREPGAGEMKAPVEATEPLKPPVKALEAQGSAPMALEPSRSRGTLQREPAGLGSQELRAQEPPHGKRGARQPQENPHQGGEGPRARRLLEPLEGGLPSPASPRSPGRSPRDTPAWEQAALSAGGEPGVGGTGPCWRRSPAPPCREPPLPWGRERGSTQPQAGNASRAGGQDLPPESDTPPALETRGPGLAPPPGRPHGSPLRREKVFLRPSRPEQRAAVCRLVQLQAEGGRRHQRDKERQQLRVQERLSIARHRSAEELPSLHQPPTEPVLQEARAQQRLALKQQLEQVKRARTQGLQARRQRNTLSFQELLEPLAVPGQEGNELSRAGQA